MEIKAISQFKLNKDIFRIMRYIKAIDNYKIEDVEKVLGVSKENVLKAMTISFCKSFDEATFISNDDSFFELISDLNETEKKILLLRYKHNLLQSDIGKILNLTPKTVSIKIKSSLSKIRRDFF